MFVTIRNSFYRELFEKLTFISGTSFQSNLEEIQSNLSTQVSELQKKNVRIISSYFEKKRIFDFETDILFHLFAGTIDKTNR